MNVKRIINAASNVAKTQETCSRIESMGWATHYSEPGYDDPKRGGVFFANWNDVDHYDAGGNVGSITSFSVLTRTGSLIQSSACTCLPTTNRRTSSCQPSNDARLGRKKKGRTSK